MNRFPLVCPFPSVLVRGRRLCAGFIWLLALAAACADIQTNLLVPAGSIWKYLDDGSDQGSPWRSPDFDDISWSDGYAQLGYGDADEETELYYGPIPNQKFITYYFRIAFPVSGASNYTSLTLRVLRDDGAIVYLNGTEVWRNNMPEGVIDYRTLASTNVNGSPGETTYYEADASGSLLVEGPNVLAVEVHQIAGHSADLSFDLALTGISVPPVPPEIVRGPYLQQGTSSSMIIRWRTSVPTDSEVRVHDWVGPERVFSDATPTSNHAVRVSGLLEDTGYWYTVGTSELIMAGADLSHYFVTAPTNSRLTRVWAIGDAGTRGAEQHAVYQSYRAFGTSADVWLMLGDNAYPSGTDTDYQAAVFDMYPDTLRMVPVWSTIGNHEQEGRSGTSDHFPYLDIFSPPENGEAGGVPSGTKRYYSFDYANIHFVCLDSWTSDRSSNGPMCTWLREDLAETSKDWIIAYWHHPPYSKGHHHSDYEIELIEMRENAVPILEAAGADLVLCGHSHSYERSFLINGHYGDSLSFQPSMKMDSGSGRRNDTGPYFKPPTGPTANQGTVYVVAGCSGLVTPSLLGHPAMFFSELELGSLILDINGPTLEAQFIHASFIDDEPIVVADYFTIYKGSPVRLIVRRMDEEMLHFSWSTQPGLYYRLQQATDLALRDWIDMRAGGRAETDQLTATLPVSAELPAAYYRVLEYVD